MNIGDELAATPVGTSRRRLVPMKVGAAIVYFEQVVEAPVVETDGGIHPMVPSPEEAFQKAGEVLRKCVRVLGGQVTGLARRTRPQTIEAERPSATAGGEVR
jgi:hypothetical protein